MNIYNEKEFKSTEFSIPFDKKNGNIPLPKKIIEKLGIIDGTPLNIKILFNSKIDWTMIIKSTTAEVAATL